MVFVVAEIGVNWNGDLEIAEKMMNQAKDANCDAVKFQAFNDEIVKDHPQKDRLLSCSISQKNIKQIDQIAKKVGIEWFCTPMYYEAIKMLNPFVKRFKIRERDGRPLLENKSTKLLKEVFESKKEVIISSEKSPKNLGINKINNIKWLYCIPKYPCPFKELKFEVLKDFDGFSNHCNLLKAPIEAVKNGAKIIEIHTTVDKSKDFFDNNVSFDENELQEIVKQIRAIKK